MSGLVLKAELEQIPDNFPSQKVHICLLRDVHEQMHVAC